MVVVQADVLQPLGRVGRAKADGVVPSTPADAGGLMLAALEHDVPVIYLEHKLLADYWLESMGIGGRKTTQFDVPAAGALGSVPKIWEPTPLGKAATRRFGKDLTMVSVGVGVHRAIEAADKLQEAGISTGVLDLRSVWPLDETAVCKAAAKTGRLLVIDEDYERFRLSGELAAVVMEAGIRAKYGRVCTRSTIPYARHLEDQTLPNVDRILEKAQALLT